MTADQRAVANILRLADEALEMNALHDHLATWRCLAEIKVLAEGLASRPAAIDMDNALDLGSI